MGMGGESFTPVVQARKKDAVAALEVRVVWEYHMELDNQVSQLLQGDK